MKQRKSKVKSASIILFSISILIVVVTNSGFAQGASPTDKIIGALRVKVNNLEARLAGLESAPRLAKGEKGDTGPQGPVGPPGPTSTSSPNKMLNQGYLVKLSPQDVVASVASKAERVVISKSGFNRGFYNLYGEISLLFQSTSSQVVLCKLDTTGNSYSYSGFPSHELANSWTGHTVQILGLVFIDSSTDKLSVSCSFTGNTKINYGYLNLFSVETPIISDSDQVLAASPVQSSATTTTTSTTSIPQPVPAPTVVATTEITQLSIFGRPYQDTLNSWYIPITNSASETIPRYSTLQIKVSGLDWADITSNQKCGSTGCGAVVNGFTNVCPQFRLIARSNGIITTIWSKSPASGGTC